MEIPENPDMPLCQRFPHRLFSCILSCTIFLLLVSVQIGTGWVIYSYTIQPFYAGLWLICSENKCSFMTIKEVNMDFIRSFMVAAIFTCFIAILCSAEWHYLKKCTPDYFPQGPYAAFFNIITGIFVLIAVVLFHLIVLKSVSSGQSKPPLKQWAFYMSCVICCLSFVTGIYDLILYKLSLWEAGTPVLGVSPE